MPHPKFLIAGALIIGAIFWLMFSGVNNSMVYYYTVTELTDKAPELVGRGLRLSGQVKPGTIVRDDSLSRVEFLVWEQATDKTIRTVYRGIIPDTFKDRAEVVVEGKYHLEDGVFRANTLLAKCPSKYEGQEGNPETYKDKEGYSEGAYGTAAAAAQESR